MMIMIYFATSNKWVGIIMSVHFSTVVEIVVFIIPKNTMTKPALHRTRQSFKSSGIVFQVMVAVEEDVFVVAKIIKAMGTMNRSRLECQILPTSPTMEFIVLMGYGLLIVANVIFGVALPMLTPLISIMLPFWLVSAIISLQLSTPPLLFLQKHGQ